MRRNILTMTLAATLLLTGCGGGDDEETPAQAAPGATSSAASDDHKEALRTAIESYANAQMSGDVAGVLGYIHPVLCSEGDKAQYSLAAGAMEETAKGASIKIKGVRIEGDRGTFTEYELSNNAPESLRRLMKATNAGAGAMGWVFYDGEWYRDADCEGTKTASPVPTT